MKRCIKHILDYCKDKRLVKRYEETSLRIKQMLIEDSIRLANKAKSINSVRDASLETLKPFRI